MQAPLKPVLFTTDLSDSSWGAFPKALWMSKRLERPLHVLCVAEPSSSLFEAADSAEYRRRMREEKKLLGERLTLELQARAPGVDLKAHIGESDGNVSQAIIHHAEDLRAGLIVMATLGRTEFSDYLVGSTAEKVVRHSPIPVLTVRVPADDLLWT